MNAQPDLRRPQPLTRNITAADEAAKAWRSKTTAVVFALCKHIGLNEEQSQAHSHAVAKYLIRNQKTTHSLMNANQTSLYAGILHLIMLGIDIGMPDHAALVPFKGSITPIPMVKGLVHLIARTLRYSPPQVHLVRRGEKFEESYGSEGVRLVYIPNRPADVTQEIVAGFVQCRTDDGRIEVFTVDGAKLRKVENYALQRAGDRDTPWKTWPDEMRRKTVIRQWASTLPLHPQMHSALDAIAGQEQSRRVAAPEVLTALSDGQVGEPEELEALDADRDEQGDDAGEQNT